MQVINTKYVPASNSRSSRIVATASGTANDARVSVPYDSGLSDASAHIEGVAALCEKLGWKGQQFIGGHSGRGSMVWVNMGDLSPRYTVGK